LDTEKAYRKFEDAKLLLEAANQAAQFQSETLRIAKDQREAGLIEPAKLEEAKLALAKAELDALQARFGVCLAGAEIERTLGKPLSN